MHYKTHGWCKYVWSFAMLKINILLGSCTKRHTSKDNAENSFCAIFIPSLHLYKKKSTSYEHLHFFLRDFLSDKSMLGSCTDIAKVLKN